jgi:hypothetical protein
MAVVPFRLGRAEAERAIRALAADPGRVVVTHHARIRMRQRGISFETVLAALRRGAVIDDPSRDVRGNWTCRVRRFAAGEELTVAVAIEWETGVLVITVFGD